MIPQENVGTALLKVVEECAEVQHAALKVWKHGMTNWHPTTKCKNSINLLNEIVDLEHAIDQLRNYIPRPPVKEMADDVMDWYNNSSLAEQREFATTKFVDLIVFHDSLGAEIRRVFNLWYYKWTPDIQEDADVSPEHPDEISLRVIEEVWRRVNAA